MVVLKDKEKIQNSIRTLEKQEITKIDTPLDYEYLINLNDSQKIVATRLDGNFLVIAGPGAGKTHTLIYRVVHMIKMGIPAQEICLITFTRKAANQLKHRLEKLLPEIELGFVGTIHSLAYTLINRSVGTSPRLIDPEDDRMILKLAIEEKSLNLPARTRVSTILKIIDYSTVTMKSIENTLIDLNKEELNPQTIKDILNAYTDYKKSNGYINYSDAIKLAAGSNRGYLKYLMIDEYQDTDPLQLQMIKNLAFPNVMAIGDDFQSIYGFRGADNKIILNFGNDFTNAKIIKMNINYRSIQEIVDGENQVTNSSEYGYKKSLISNRGLSHTPIQWMKYDELNASNSLNNIFKHITHFLNDKHSGTIAVIYRYNRMKNHLEPYLIENKIDYVVFGGKRLLERKHIKDLLSILSTNKNKNDLIPYMRALMLIDGVGEVTAKKLIDGKGPLNRADLTALMRIINEDYTNINLLLNDASHFYMSLDSILIKSKYSKEEIIEDFQLLNEIGENYQSIDNFISDIILDSSTDKWSKKDKTARVILTTIHSSKGLEFDEVHFLYEPSVVYSLKNAEENRRLFYTAISRAKNKLTIYDSWGRQGMDIILKDFEIEHSYLGNHFDYTEKNMNTRIENRKRSSNDSSSNIFKKIFSIFSKKHN